MMPGLQRQQFGEFGGALRRHQVRGVPPQHVRLVAGEDFAHLRHGDLVEVLVEAAFVGVVPALAILVSGLGAARIGPVLGLGIVEAEFQALRPRGLGQRGDQILFPRSGIGDIPVAGARGEQGETVVMFRGDHHVAHAGFLGQGGPCRGIIFHRIEILGIGLVAVHRDFAVEHDPLADAADLFAVVGSGGHRIDAPMDEHAELRLAPPSHAGIALGRGFIGIGISLHGRAMEPRRPTRVASASVRAILFFMSVPIRQRRKRHLTGFFPVADLTAFEKQGELMTVIGEMRPGEHPQARPRRAWPTTAASTSFARRRWPLPAVSR